MRTYASSRGRAFIEKSELQMFLLIPGGHTGGQKLWTETDRNCPPIVCFHMTSPKIKLKNYRSYRDFTFPMH